MTCLDSMTSRSGAQDGRRKCAGRVAVFLFSDGSVIVACEGFLDDELRRRRGRDVVVVVVF